MKRKVCIYVYVNHCCSPFKIAFFLKLDECIRKPELHCFLNLSVSVVKNDVPRRRNLYEFGAKQVFSFVCNVNLVKHRKIHEPSKWDKLSEKGAAGKDGRDGLDGKDGVNGTNGTNGKDGRDGTNGKDGKDGANGADGVSIVWKGELAAAPAEPQLNWAYYNTEAGCAYIWNGTKWDKLSEKGATGETGAAGKDGANGTDGVSIIWKGELAAAPLEPQLNWAYYNTEAGCAYIWNGTKWDKLSEKGATGEIGAAGKDGKDGRDGLDGKDGVNGTNGTNGKDGKDGRDGTNGKDGKDGANGADGVSIVWKGERFKAPAEPELNWAYYNIQTCCSYIYDGHEWNLLSGVEENRKLNVLPAGTDGSAGTDGIYVALGSFPQTIKAADVTIDETVTKTQGAYTYYKGSDGEWYAKQAEKAYGSSYKYSDGTAVGRGGTSYKYFKVEPVKWRVLTDDYSGKKLLHAENILINKRFGYGSNIYEYSEIREWLNGDFIHTAFSTTELALIAETDVDNSPRSTNPDANATQWDNGENRWVCGNTTDKIFLLSEQEVTKSEYGFTAYDVYGKGNSRICVTTDFAKACGACQNTSDGFGGYWWLRSPTYYDSFATRRVSDYGYAGLYSSVALDDFGVVPALCLN